MEIQELWRVIVQRWRIVLTGTLVCVALALGWSMAGPVTYRAETRIIISTSGSLGTAVDALNGEQVSVQRAPTYAELLRGPEVAKRASEILQGAIPADTIRAALQARISSRLPMVVVSAESRSAEDAVHMVSAAERGLQQFVGEIERPGKDGSLTSVALSGDPPTVVRVGSPLTTAMLAGLVGLVLGTILAVYRDRTDPVVKSAPQIATLGLGYRGTVSVTSDISSVVNDFRRVAVACVSANGPAMRKILVVGVDSECDTAFAGFGLAVGLAACGRTATFVDATGASAASDGPGLSDVLRGRQPWSECISPDDETDIWTMGVGTAASEGLDRLLITTDASASVLPPLEDHESVIFAAGSINDSSDAIALTVLAESALIVVRPGISTIVDIEAARLLLNALGIDIVGMILVHGKSEEPRTLSRRARHHQRDRDDVQPATTPLRAVPSLSAGPVRPTSGRVDAGERAIRNGHRRSGINSAPGNHGG